VSNISGWHPLPLAVSKLPSPDFAAKTAHVCYARLELLMLYG